MEKTFAAFIMTYRRPAILATTIQALYKQTLPPTKILIVDNDPEQSAKGVLEAFPEKNISYYAVGHNSGPAGAAYWGMKLLFEEGWEWVLWMDDDDPPVIHNLFERMFALKNKYSEPDKIGIIGGVGVLFHKYAGKTQRLKLNNPDEIFEVDNIAGGQFPIVNRNVFEKNILPNPKYFFGFEELEFNLRIRKAGLKIIVFAEILNELRVFWNKTDYKRKIISKRPKELLWREYYSTRNLTRILISENGSLIGLLRFFIKSILKSIYGFRDGFNYGWKNAIILHHGFWDGIFGKMGMRFLPQKKD